MKYSQLPPTLLKELKLQGVKRKLEEMKVDMMKSIAGTFDQKLDVLIGELDYLDEASPDNSERKDVGMSKTYVSRPSLLSELLRVNHIRSIYNIFIAILIILMVNTIVIDLFDHRRSMLGFDLIKSSFGNLPLVISTWFCMFLSTTLILYPLFHLWSTTRRPGGLGKRDIPWILTYCLYQVVFLVLPVITVVTHHLPTSSSFIVVTEQVRLFMKAHAFVREKVPMVISEKEKKAPPSSDFTKFLFFLFAPTLIYRDHYPRSQGPISWRYVATNFLQVVASLFYMYFIFERFCIPHFRNFGRHSTSLHLLLLSIFSSVLPATLVLFITFFAILHSWLNAFAEMLQFADRLFYKDWWNSASFSKYYRTWNVVVHDWLYAYVYRDVYKLLGNRHRAIPMGLVFFLSALVHEYILSVAFGFVYPVLFFMFAGAGFAFIFIPQKSHATGNVFLWVALFIGNGVLMCLYSMEFYARRRCPANTNSFLDLFIPRSWTCDFDRIGSSSSSSPPSSSSSSSSHIEL